MARAIAISTAVGAAIAACFTTPGRPPGGGVRDDAGNLLDDASMADDADPDSMFLNPDAPTGTCTVEEFNGSGSGSCGSWGTFSFSGGSGYVSQASGKLTLGLFGSNAGYVNCKSPTGSVQRVVIDLASVAATEPGKEATFVGLATSDNAKRWGLTFADNGSGAVAYTPTCAADGDVLAVAWNSSKARFVQIEKWMTGSVRISTSPDNTVYDEVHVCADAAEVFQNASVVQLQLSKSPTTNSSQVASFERLEICR